MTIGNDLRIGLGQPLDVSPQPNRLTIDKTLAPAQQEAPLADVQGPDPRSLKVVTATPAPGLVLPPPSNPRPANIDPTLRAAFDAAPASGAGPAKQTLLSENTHAWAARWDALDGAQDSIQTGYFNFERDIFGYAYLGHVLKKMRDRQAEIKRTGQGKPLEVQHLADFAADAGGNILQGNFWLFYKDYLQVLVNRGATVGFYNTIPKRLGALVKDPSGYGVVSSYHDKNFVVDGRITITGGRNIAAPYMNVNRRSAWDDMDTIIEGAGPAAGAKVAFDAEMKSDAVSLVEKDNKETNEHEAELIGTHYLMDLWMKGEALDEETVDRLTCDPDVNHPGDPATQERFRDELLQQAVAALAKDGLQPNEKQLEFLRERALELVTYPSTRGSLETYREYKRTHTRDVEVKILDKVAAATGTLDQFDDAEAKILAAARHTVFIEDPYVNLPESHVRALEEAVKRNPNLEIVIGTNSPASTDSAVTQAFFLKDWPDLQARIPNMRIIVATTPIKHHGKTILVDGQVASIGSNNRDLLSDKANSEIAAISHGKEFCADLWESYKAKYNNPRFGPKEYRIKLQTDENGRKQPVLDENGKPIIEFGHRDHLEAKEIASYERQIENWDYNRKTWTRLKPLRHPPLLLALKRSGQAYTTLSGAPLAKDIVEGKESGPPEVDFTVRP